MQAPLLSFRAAAGEEDPAESAAVPSAGNSPSDVTAMLNADLRRRAVQAFA